MVRVDASSVHYLLYTAKEWNTHTHLSRRYIFWPQTFIFGQEVGFVYSIYCIVCFGVIHIRASQKFIFFPTVTLVYSFNVLCFLHARPSVVCTFYKFSKHQRPLCM